MRTSRTMRLSASAMETGTPRGEDGEPAIRIKRSGTAAFLADVESRARQLFGGDRAAGGGGALAGAFSLPAAVRG